MNSNLKKRLIDSLVTTDRHLNRYKIESNYIKRDLEKGAEVTRFCPSPTGYVHIGGIFTAMICQTLARQTNGVYILRIEDTDKRREVEGAKELIVKQLHAFSLSPDEGLQIDGTSKGNYGPYIQSERADIYLAYAIDLLEKGRAYPCFATADELADAVKEQQSKKLRPGYYGEWALWRDRDDVEVERALNDGKPFVLRFRSEGSHAQRVQFDDVLKGHMDVPENDLDVPLIKSDNHRLPTYHLAHVVDDYLMGSTIILRGEEWLPSTPLHIELAQALGIKPFRYAHTPVISIIDPAGGGKRKLSKRKDPEADVAYWLKAAYPIESIKAYLMGLANSNYEDWRVAHLDKTTDDFPFSLEKLASSRSPLLDIKKLEDYARDDIARMSQDHFNKQVLAWTEVHHKTLFDAMMVDPDYTNAVLSIERTGEKPRKDVAKWSDAPEQFGYFYDNIFEINILPNVKCENEEQFSESAKQDLSFFLQNYDHSADKEKWFENMKSSAEEAGYTLDRNELKNHPDKYKGGLADFAGLVRINLTGKTRTPDLYEIMQIMGENRVRNRLKKK